MKRSKRIEIKEMNFEIMVNPGDRIKVLRMQRGYSQEYLASQLEVDTGTVSNLENGKHKLTVDRLYKIAQILKVRPRDIIEEISNDEIGIEDQLKKCIEENRQLLLKYTNILEEERAKYITTKTP